MNRAELLEQIHAGRKQLEDALAQFGDAEMLVAALPSGWTIKDMLAHLGWWERRIVSAYATLARGEMPDPESDAVPVDDLNARVFAQNHNRPLAEVRRDEGEAYGAILALAENAPEDDLFNPNRFAWTAGRAFVEWIGDNTYGHYDEHLPDLRALRGM
jgi:hypothetical protein